MEEKFLQFNRLDFVEDDPIRIPHRFSVQQDIEVAGFFAAILAWGNRKSIINSCNRLMELMDHSPYDFIKNHSDMDLKRLVHFKHRTFQPTDLLYFVHFLNYHYSRSDTLETAFCMDEKDMESRLNAFRNYFFSLPDYPERTQKHIAAPYKKSSCKRLNMFLRWMVRSDNSGVDFGIWQKISTSELICPFDVHVGKVSRALGLVARKQNDWMAATELTVRLRDFDPEDPVKYDFALFGYGIEQSSQDKL